MKTWLGDLAIAPAGSNTGVRMLRPIPNMSLCQGYYLDCFQLIATGAERFSNAIIGELLK
jgi:hypothetical protein